MYQLNQFFGRKVVREKIEINIIVKLLIASQHSETKTRKRFFLGIY